MWMHQAVLLIQSISTLRSLSWGVLALSFLALLVGLYVWNSNVRLLTTLALQLSLNNFPKNSPNTVNGYDSSSVSPELLTATVTRLADAYKVNRRRVAALSITFLFIAVLSVWTEVHAKDIRNFENVYVSERLNDYDFRMMVMNPNTQRWIPFAVNFCHDYRPTDEIQAGVVLPVLAMEENQADHCFELAPKHLGYTILRGENNEPIINMSYTRQTAASR